MQKYLRAVVLTALVLWPSIAFAAIIGPKDDWKPLRAGARALGVSDEMVKRILAAGVQLSCPGTVHDNGGILNGWFLGNDATSFYTNAHGVIEIGADKKSNFIEPLDKCAVHSYRDLVANGIKAASYALAGARQPQRIDPGDLPSRRATSPIHDRAQLRLRRSIAGAKALALPDFNRINLAVGEQVIMVSLRPPKMQEPEIQACNIQSINLHSMGPGQLFTDCDNGFGNSAALYFVRDPSNPTMLLPIALHEGCREKLGDHKGWSLEDNTAVAIMLRDQFFAFQGRS